MSATEIQNTGRYHPTQDQLRNQQQDQQDIDDALDYRRQFELPWEKGIKKWNFLAPESIEGVPNYVVPMSRMATQTGVISMRQSLPEIVPIPAHKDEKRISELLSDASAYVHMQTNMEAVMDQAIVDFAVCGNMVLESFVEIPYKNKRVPVLGENGEKTGKHKMMSVRDWSKPKVGTRHRSIWECAFDPGAKTPSEIRYCWFQDRMSMAEFEEKYKNLPESDYINLELVKPGEVWVFNENQQLERTEVSHKKVIIDHYQNELQDCWRIYANGILIYDGSLSELHTHGKITLSLIPNHHKYDQNLRTHALYGSGDPELLEDLDDLVQAITNMFIKNYQNSNTYVVGIEDGALDVQEIELESGTPISGRVSVQSLGASNLPEWEAFKNNIEEWAIQMAKKNYKRLEGEVAKTATEIIQKRQSENQGMKYQIKKMESGGLLEYAKKHISDIMEHFTVEEWQNVTDEDAATIEAMIGEELKNDDVIRRKVNGKLVPVKVRYTERFQTRGRVYKESSKRDVQELEELKAMRGTDGWLPAAEEYLHTREWRLFKKVPQIYLKGQTMLGQDELIEQAKIERLILSIGNLGAVLPVLQQLGIDVQQVKDKMFEVIDLRPDEFSSKEGDEDMEKINNAISSAEQAYDTSLTSIPSAPSPLDTAGLGTNQGAQAGNPPLAATGIGGA